MPERTHRDVRHGNAPNVMLLDRKRSTKPIFFELSNVGQTSDLDWWEDIMHELASTQAFWLGHLFHALPRQLALSEFAEE